MNTTPNPLIPQGTFLEHKTKSHFRIAVFTILAVHVVLIGSFLLAGCKRTTDTAGLEHTNDAASYPPPPVTPLPDTSTTAATAANVAVAPPANAGPPPIPNTLRPVTNVLPPEPGPGALPPPIPTTQVATGLQGDHVVVKGDSFSTIAKKYGVSVRAIQEANPGVDPLRLKIGQKLVIPARSGSPPTMAVSNGAVAMNGGSTYTVKSGDTLNKIAREHGITVQELQTANNLKTTQIKVGQKLRIPSKGGGTPVPPPTAVQ
jgi:LysM repeat protein